MPFILGWLQKSPTGIGQYYRDENYTPKEVIEMVRSVMGGSISTVSQSLAQVRLSCLTHAENVLCCPAEGTGMRIIMCVSGLLILAGAAAAWHYGHLDGLAAFVIAAAGGDLVWEAATREEPNRRRAEK
jgi:hypothetical protein